jgi:hypothetical protein
VTDIRRPDEETIVVTRLNHDKPSQQEQSMNARIEVAPIDDLRSYIAALEANGQLHRVKTKVDWKYELCHISKVNEEQKGPALLYENVMGNPIPVFTSAFSTSQRLAIALEQDPSLSMSQLSKKWMELTTKQMINLRRQAAGNGKHHRGRCGRPREFSGTLVLPGRRRTFLRHLGIPRDQ